MGFLNLTPLLSFSFLLFLITFIPTAVHAQEFQFISESQFVISDKIDDDILLTVPYRIKSFSDGHFVMQQGRDLELKLFDQEGKYQRGIGGRGRGPFEFLDISFFFINQDDQIIVFDNYQAKVSIFNKKNGLEEYSTPFATRPHIRSVHKLLNGNYLLGITRYDLRDTPHEGDLYFLMKKNYTITDSGFVNRSALHEEEPNSTPDLVMSGGPNTDSSILTMGGDLVVAPSLYTGKILVYRHSNNFSEPEFLNTQSYSVAYREYKGSLPESFQKAAKLGLNIASLSRGKTRYLQFNDSRGLFRLSTGQIIHFVQDWNEQRESAHLWMELLNKDATRVLAIEEIKNLGTIKIQNHIRKAKYHSVIDLYFLHLDNKDNIYIRTTNIRNEPELHVVKLSLTQN